MCRVMAFVVLTALFACPAVAAELGCATKEQRKESLSKLIALADALRSGVERVPPSEAEFIKREVGETIWPLAFTDLDSFSDIKFSKQTRTITRCNSTKAWRG